MEAAGLALGSVALAGLFSSCIDVLEYLETSRHWARDVHITLTKLSLMKQRLRDLGEALAIDSVASSRQSWPGSSEKEEWLISNSLRGIHGLLDATSRLCTKHGCGRGHPLHRRAQAGGDGVYWREYYDSTSTLDSLEGLGKAIRQSHPNDDAGKLSLGWRTLRSRAVWAMVDKGRFNALITELDFLISNLERLGERARMAPRSDSSFETEECERRYEAAAKPEKVLDQKSSKFSKTIYPMILEQANWEERNPAHSNAIVALATVGRADKPRGSEAIHVQEESLHQAPFGGKESQDSPSVCRNQAGNEARQVNRTEVGGPHVNDNEARDKAKQANGLFSNEVALKCFD